MNENLHMLLLHYIMNKSWAKVIGSQNSLQILVWVTRRRSRSWTEQKWGDRDRWRSCAVFGAMHPHCSGTFPFYLYFLGKLDCDITSSPAKVPLPLWSTAGWWPFWRLPHRVWATSIICILFDLQHCFPSAGYNSARLNRSPDASAARWIANHIRIIVYLK